MTSRCDVADFNSASEMTYIVSGGALNSTHPVADFNVGLCMQTVVCGTIHQLKCGHANIVGLGNFRISAF